MSFTDFGSNQTIIDLGREKVIFENIAQSFGRTFPLSLNLFPSTKSNCSPTKLIFTYAHTYVFSHVNLHICVNVCICTVIQMSFLPNDLHLTDFKCCMPMFVK